MGAVDLLGMEPDVALKSLLTGEQVVLGVVLAHRDTQARCGAKLHGLGGHPLLPPFGLAGTAEISGVGELLADLPQVLLSLGQSNVLQHAVEIVQLSAALLQLLGQHLLGGLGLVVLFIILGGVLLWGEQRVQADVHLCPLRVIKVHSTKTPHPLVHLVEVGGEDIPQLPQPLPILGGLQLLLLVGDLPGGAVPGGGHGADEILAPLLDAL